MTRASRFRALALVLLAAGAACRESKPSRDPVPRVVLVSIDTLHVAHTSAYNPEVATTPFLGGFASQGVVFEHAYTFAPVTLPSHAALLTGVTPLSLGVLANGDDLPGEALTLAERFARAGYATAAFISLGVLSRQFGLDQGFDHFHDPFGPDSARWYRTADEVYAPLASWVRENRDRPFFLWVHFSDPHDPYLPVDAPPDTELFLDQELLGRYRLRSAEKYRESFLVPPGAHQLRFVSLRSPRPDDRPETAITLSLHSLSTEAGVRGLPGPEEAVRLQPSREIELTNESSSSREVELVFSGGLERPTPADVLPHYQAEVAYTDRYLAELDALLGGAREDLLLVIVSDHGEGLFRHGLLGHATDLYEDQLRILWMMRGPGVPPGLRIEAAPARMTDVAPTLLDLAGLESSGMEGRSWTDCLEGGACPKASPFWAFALDHESRRPEAVAGYRWPFKWMWQRGESRAGYDLGRDPWEEDDLLARGAKRAPEELQRLGAGFPDERKRISEALSRTGGRALSKEREELLRSLGYLGGER